MSAPMPIVLASRSPRRRQLLEEADWPVRIEVPEVDDGLLDCGDTPADDWVSAAGRVQGDRHVDHARGAWGSRTLHHPRSGHRLRARRSGHRTAVRPGGRPLHAGVVRRRAPRCAHRRLPDRSPPRRSDGLRGSVRGAVGDARSGADRGLPRYRALARRGRTISRIGWPTDGPSMPGSGDGTSRTTTEALKTK